MTLLLPGAASGEPPASDKTEVLMQERVRTLEDLVKLVKRQYQAGQAMLGDYLSVENDLLQARIDLAPDRVSRIKLRGELVDNLKKMEAMVAERVKNGVALRADHLRARAARLAAEIELAREMEQRETPVEAGRRAEAGE